MERGMARSANFTGSRNSETRDDQLRLLNFLNAEGNEAHKISFLRRNVFRFLRSSLEESDSTHNETCLSILAHSASGIAYSRPATRATLSYLHDDYRR